jgi:hypothetical protein
VPSADIIASSTRAIRRTLPVWLGSILVALTLQHASAVDEAGSIPDDIDAVSRHQSVVPSEPEAEQTDQGRDHGHGQNAPIDRPSVGPADSKAPPDGSSQDQLALAICLALGREAMANDIPVEFFTRLVWQESRFDPKARSRAGAEGIAQFMPATAQWRGLADAYDPLQALRESARWLGQLRQRFGNLGLAAAAYNAGPERVQRWLSGQSLLPRETRYYVRAITGHSADEWARQDLAAETYRALRVIPCNAIAKLLMRSMNRQRIMARPKSTTASAPSGR